MNHGILLVSINPDFQTVHLLWAIVISVAEIYLPASMPVNFPWASA
jgi:hypothetical protein